MKTISTSLLMLSLLKLNAQNFVPNPSFESFINCPVNHGEINQSQGWTSFGGNPDYFNSCSPDTMVSVPKNDFGYQMAATGNAYCGFINASGGPAPSPEYLGATLSQPLVTGQKYFASFKISFASAHCATNKMGVCFSTVPYNSSSPPPLNNNAFVYTDSIISDTANWYQITGSFIADSGYTYLMIGNFFTNGSGCPAGTYVSYYYVDDVCVSTDSLTCYSTVGIHELNNNNELIAFPNPFADVLTIKTGINDKTVLKLYDIASRKLREQNFINTVSLNTSDLAKGIYFYEVKNENSVIGKGKVVKEY